MGSKIDIPVGALGFEFNSFCDMIKRWGCIEISERLKGTGTTISVSLRKRLKSFQGMNVPNPVT